jgi:hypothetical protein
MNGKSLLDPRSRRTNTASFFSFDLLLFLDGEFYVLTGSSIMIDSYFLVAGLISSAA